MENKRQTAVEWLVKELNSEINYIPMAHWDKIRGLVQKAKAMEKEELRKFFFIGWNTRERFDDLVPDIIYPEGLDYEEKQEYVFEQFYKEAYEVK
ncbi:MAG: hypothetical protein EBU90_25590 [Proteobacteria bacterium]|nr:hypothetical protein [Pseudomonadota bacterium]